MGKFNTYKGGRSNSVRFDSGRGDGRDTYRGGRDRDRGGAQRFSATCSDCGKQCDVPFKPTGKHPVFCNDCFRAQKGDRGMHTTKRDAGRHGRGSFDRNSGRPAPANAQAAPGITRAQFESLEKKVDSILSLLHSERRDAAHAAAQEEAAPSAAARSVKKTLKKAAKKTLKKVAPKKASSKKAKKKA